MSKLQINKLADRSHIGLDMLHVNCEEAYFFLENLPVHRDDNFVFIFMEKGLATLTVDFDHVLLQERQVYFMLPGQVHHNIKSRGCVGWSIAISPPLVNNNFKQIFELQHQKQKPLQISAEIFDQCEKLLSVLYANFRSEQTNDFHLQFIHSLLNALLAIYAREFKDSISTQDQTSRFFQISQQFRTELGRNIIHEKNPSAYAEKLHLSEIYLNKAVKATTGFTVSYWILQEVMIQAKRLLYYSNLSVKEVAYEIGFEDHTYFSRLFKKTNQITPIEFRKQYLK